MACIAVGVAAVVLVAGLSTSVSDGVRTEGRRLMAADLVVEGRRPLPAELDDAARARAGGVRARTDVREFVSVVVDAGGAISQPARGAEGRRRRLPVLRHAEARPAGPLSELLDAQQPSSSPPSCCRGWT